MSNINHLMPVTVPDLTVLAPRRGLILLVPGILRLKLVLVAAAR
jgi:hypothetical protein